MVGAGSVGSAVYCMRLAGVTGKVKVLDKDVIKIENFNRSPIFEGIQRFFVVLIRHFEHQLFIAALDLECKKSVGDNLLACERCAGRAVKRPPRQYIGAPHLVAQGTELRARSFPFPPSKPDLCVGISCGKSVHVGEAEVTGAVASIGFCFLVFDDREGRVDVADVITVCDAVEMKEHGVELGAQDQAAVFVPGEGRLYLARLIDMAHIAGEGRHVMRGVGQLKNGLSDNLTGRLGAEADGLVAVGRDDGKLLDCVPSEMRALNLLTSNIIESKAVEIG